MPERLLKREMRGGFDKLTEEVRLSASGFDNWARTGWCASRRVSANWQEAGERSKTVTEHSETRRSSRARPCTSRQRD